MNVLMRMVELKQWIWNGLNYLSFLENGKN
nr:MAG TPA: hypothetical protein [Caudoviricetes sp.]